MKNKKSAFIASLLFLLVLYFLSKFDSGTVVYEFRSNYSQSLTDPLECLSIALVVTTSILLFFSDKVFTFWLKKFMIWFAPLAVLLIILGSTEVNYGWPTRTDFAMLMGGVLVVATLIVALAQRFYYKTK